MARAGLADKGTHVDQAGRHDLAGAIDDLGAFRHAGSCDALPASRITPSAISTSPRWSMSRDGSIRRALASRSGAWAYGFFVAGDHAFGRLRASASSTAMRTATPISTCSRISDCAPSATDGVDLDAAVHRAGMHDERVGLGDSQFLLVEAE
jgi:hypothetical protein